MKTKISLFLCLFILSFNTKAQDGFENILIAGTADSEKLLEGYFAPAMEGFTYAMNNSWYHTAKVHKVLGFDVTIGASGALIPSAKEVFSVTGLTTTDQNSYTGPTLAGDGNGGNLSITTNGNTTSFTMPATSLPGVKGKSGLN